MDASYFRTLFDHQYWARDRVLAAAAGMSEAEYARPNGFTYGSIRGILTHILASESGYLRRWQGEPPAGPTTAADLPTLAALSERWQEQEANMRAYLSGLSDADLDREIVSRRSSGEEFRRSLALDMAQIINHGTQHRSEAAEALTMVGRSPGDLDLSVYLRNRQSA